MVSDGILFEVVTRPLSKVQAISRPLSRIKLALFRPPILGETALKYAVKLSEEN